MSSAVESATDIYVTDVKGNVLKKEKDCSEIAECALQISGQHLQNGNFDEAIDILLGAEKQARMAVDLQTTSRLIIYIIQACFTMKKYDQLNAYVVLLMKRRGQFKQAVTNLVQECCSIAQQMTDLNEQIRFIETVTNETIGKVYVENERARLVRKLANIKEQQGNIKDASILMQDLQVESYVAMPAEEKVDFLLEQLRLVFDQKNYSLAETISNKIDPKSFSDNFEMTNKYHILMARLQNHFKNYIRVAIHYKALLNSEFVMPGTAIWAEAARGVIVIMLMAERCDDQVEEIKKLRKLKNIDDVAPYSELLSLFLHNELIDIDWFVHKYKDRFIQDLSGLVCNFNMNTEDGRANWQTFLDRITEYNIYVISQHYSTIKLATMSRHLKLPADIVERYICSLVEKDSIYARINSPEGYVCFSEVKNDSTLLNEWSTNFKQLVLDLKSLNDNIKKEISIHNDSTQNNLNDPTDLTYQIAIAAKKRVEKLENRNESE